MIEEINNTAAIKDRLIQEGKIKQRNLAEEFEAINEMNKTMEEVQREFKVKNNNSEISASKTVLTA